ncbi:hypothetical protein SEVIR_9G134801v4 [Setaria viridis]
MHLHICHPRTNEETILPLLLTWRATSSCQRGSTMENDHAAPAVFFFLLLFFSHCPSHRAASSSLLLPPRSITMEADEDADSDSLGALPCPPPQCPSPPSPWGRRGAAPRSPPRTSHVTASPRASALPPTATPPCARTRSTSPAQAPAPTRPHARADPWAPASPSPTPARGAPRTPDPPPLKSVKHRVVPNAAVQRGRR